MSHTEPDRRHLLVPMDDSDPARAALEHTLRLFSDEKITVVTVVDELESHYGGGPATEDTDRKPDFFEAVDASADDHGTSVKTVVLSGTPAETILEYVEQESIDQVIMGSAGRSGVSRVLLGSVAEQVSRRSPVPVTIVR